MPPDAARPRLEPALFVIFGATGDLAKRKLLPAVQRLMERGTLDQPLQILGVARDDIDEAAFRTMIREALGEHGLDAETLDRWCNDCLAYQPLPDDEAATYTALRERIEAIEAERELPGNRVFYLALPPVAFGPTATRLGEADLARSAGWTRLVIEKPFGTDLQSALELNEAVHRHFGEKQIYRIDHYLGKETVQNLLAFRFANPLFEHAWNRDRVERVEITVAESLGLERRADYYERAGALRDMVQNHVTQLLAFVAMEVPAAFEADAIRHEKVKVLRSIEAFREGDVVFGQYDAGEVDGERVPGYRDEPGVADESPTATFMAMRVRVANWRWQDVPFVVRTGKRMPRKLTEIAVVFRAPPRAIFKPYDDECETHGDVLRITLQPDEGFHLDFDVKIPGETFALSKQRLEFSYGEAFDAIPEAYETLLRDVFEGDQTLFVHAEEVEASWRLYTPLLEDPPPTRRYPAGSWGPDEVAALLPSEEWYSNGADGNDRAEDGSDGVLRHRPLTVRS